MELRDRLQSTLGSAYSVERELGGGGMSRVFVAHEIALGRKVVVKVLSGDAVEGLSGERFAREVRLAASLQHPNIVPVLTTGVADGIPYYTMPYVKGESLGARMKESPPLTRRKAVSVLRDIARALQFAHGEGVIHRDIKPDNVLLSGDAAVVTDFGIAKAISAARSSASDPNAQTGSSLTRAGSTVGTPAYMAPEQAAADTVDYRADIYSWGMVAYELLAGVHPFANKTSAVHLMAAQLTEVPAPLAVKAPDVPESITNLVMRCLEKSPEQRPASATELLETMDTAFETPGQAIPSVARGNRNRVVGLILLVATMLSVGAYAYRARGRETAMPRAKSSVAVLPFADDRADSANAYFGEGIADELMTALGKVPGLRVASRTSAIAVGKRHELDVREIGHQLGVSTVVEGTVRRAGGKLRVTAQLTNAADGLTLWGDSYERDSKDVFAVQDEITQSIVAALRPEFLAAGNPAAQRAALGSSTTNPDAYDLFLRGLYLLERRGPGVAQAAEYFSQAIAKDPGFARAYAGLALALEFFPYFAGVPAQRIEARARAAASRSLQLDPRLAEPRVAMAMADWHAKRWNEADAEFRRAIDADSTSSVAHTQYGRFLFSAGRIPDAVRELRIARRLDPLAATASVLLSHALAQGTDQAAAWNESKRARELDPGLYTARAFLAFDRIYEGHPEEARAIADGPTPNSQFNGMIAYVFGKAGDPKRAAAIRKTLDATPDTTWMIHTSRAYAYAATPDTARVLSEMEAAVARREILPQAMFFGERLLDPIRHSARFAEIVRKAGLEGRGFTSRTGNRPAP